MRPWPIPTSLFMSLLKSFGVCWALHCFQFFLLPFSTSPLGYLAVFRGSHMTVLRGYSWFSAQVFQSGFSGTMWCRASNPEFHMQDRCSATKPYPSHCRFFFYKKHKRDLKVHFISDPMKVPNHLIKNVLVLNGLKSICKNLSVGLER